MARTVSKPCFLAFTLLLSVAVLVPAPPSQAQGRPDCASVMRTIHKTKKRHGRSIDSQDIAEAMGSDSVWIEKCASTYGRRLHSSNKKSGDDDDLTAKREEEEYEEFAHEEADEQANRVQQDLRNGVYATNDKGRGIDPDSSMEWEPYITHEWEPYITHEWNGPFIHDDDDPGFE